MGFLSLLRVASMPIVQVLIISILGAFMATDYLNLLSSDARKSLNKIVYFVFLVIRYYSTDCVCGLHSITSVWKSRED
ncbi:hypothetical protein MIMGU_mgv1a0088072mg, partial [Erythranthe guttata]